MFKELFSNSFKFWREIINLWTILFVFSIIYDFVGNNSLSDILGPLSAIYIGVLAIYVGNKEFERWYNRRKGKHPGEFFVILWTVLIFTIIILDIAFKKDYVLPSSVVSSYLAVLTILVLTRKSKALYKRKNK
jgi:ABC-type transport system involved in cytochrome c biogenesis permease subunit